jgi:hypothetical protein
MISNDVFPEKNVTSFIAYNACIQLLSLLNTLTSVRMIMSKGSDTAKLFISLIWKILAVKRVTNTDIIMNNDQDIQALHIKPNPIICELLKRSLKNCTQQFSNSFRKAHIALCMQISMESSIVDTVSNDMKESHYIRTLSMIQVLIESHSRQDQQGTFLFSFLFSFLIIFVFISPLRTHSLTLVFIFQITIFVTI